MIEEQLQIEEDGDEVFTTTPKVCVKCGGVVEKNEQGFYVCKNCGCSYGK